MPTGKQLLADYLARCRAAGRAACRANQYRGHPTEANPYVALRKDWQSFNDGWREEAERYAIPVPSLQERDPGGPEP